MVKGMLNNGNKKACGSDDQFVAYIYDEIGTEERRKFESHLLDCAVCTDEFAAISDARFAVFEWQKEEFSHLSTPEIEIPYLSTAQARDPQPVGALSGWFGSLAWLNPRFGIAFAVVAVIAVGIFAIRYVGFGGAKAPITAEVNIKAVPPVEPIQDAAVATIPKVEAEVADQVDPESRTVSIVDRQATYPRASKVASNRPKVREKKTIETSDPETRVAVHPVQKTQDMKAPVLSNYVDTDDTSLRLTDLFDEEVGAKL